MKKALTLFIILIVLINKFTAQDCRPSTFETDFRPNNVSSKIWLGGELTTMNGGYRIVSGECNNIDYPSTVFASTLWMGGTTSDGITRVAGTTYRGQNDEFDWYPGPLDEEGKTIQTNCANWDRTFEIRAEDIILLTSNYENNIFIGTDCSKIPQSVKYWPAKGNPYWREKYEFDLPNQVLATFYDYDKDGLYDPCKGDIPSLDFVSDDDSEKKPDYIINTFPSQLLFWIINDNGGPHWLTSGDALRMELHLYAYGYKGEKDIDNTSFFHIRSIYKGELDLDNTFISLWLDPDLGCYTDDYMGTDTLQDMMYVYNQDAVDGTNGVFCPSNIKTFGDKIPIMGFQLIEGLKDTKDGILNDIGMTSTMILSNGSVGSPEPPTTDPEGSDISFYNIMNGLWKTGDAVTKGGTGYNLASTDSIKYFFTDPPDDPNGWSMCTANIGFGDRRILMSSGGNVKMKKGDVNDIVLAYIYQPSSILPCPSIKPLQSIAKKVKILHNNRYKFTEGPDAPEVSYKAKNNKIVLKLNNDFPGSNNKNLGYSSKVDGVDAFYKFEGYKVYQHSEACFGSSAYENINLSKLILQYDLQNEVDDIYNWEDDGYQFNKILKVSGNNAGVPDSIVIDYDYLNDKELVNGETYYYEVIAYGHNNYMDYDSITDKGQKQAYIEGTGHRKLYKITPLLQNENDDLGVQIIRLKGELVSRFNQLQPEFDPFTFDFNNGVVDDTITYKQGFGPFSVSIEDETKIDTSILYKININGNFDNGSSICSYTDSTLTYEVINDKTGEILIPQSLVNGKNDILLDEIGLKLNIHFNDDPTIYKDQTGNFNIRYKDDNGVKWFNSLKNNVNPIKSNEENILDPVEDLAKDKSSLDLEINNYGFFPFVNSKFTENQENKFYVSPTSSPAHSVFASSLGDINLKELNNVQLVLTSDKSKWSRCIVVEGCSSFFTENGIFNTLDGSKMLETRSTPSIDKNGNPDNSGTNGFSWFPGYAYDIEKGERLNIFFAENTCFRDLPGYETTSTDMIFNPNDVTIDESTNDFRKYIVGGHHFIYVTRQKYDECQQLSIGLKKGTNNFSKRNSLAAISWTSVPVLNKGQNLLPIEQGLIPNDVVVDLRTTNSFTREKFVTDITKITNCNSEPDDPSYLLKIGKKSFTNAVKNIALYKDLIQIKSGVNHFSVANLNAQSQIEVLNINGTILESYQTKNPSFHWQADNNISTGMYIVTVKDINGRMSSGKVIVVR